MRDFLKTNWAENTLWTIISIACGVFLYGCTTTRNIDKPVEGYSTAVYKPAISTVAIPVSIQLKTLLDRLNKQLDGLLYADTSFDGDNLMLKVWKAQPITLGVSDNVISYRIPLHIWLNTGISRWGFTIQKDMQMDLALKYHTNIAIQPDWSVQSTTRSDGYEWLNDPYIAIAGLQIPVKSIANRIIEGLQAQVGPAIDRQIAQNINIRRYADDLWTRLQQPLLINSDYHLWLKLQPVELFMTPFSSNSTTIMATIGMQALSEMYVSKQTPVVTDVSVLPPYKMPASVVNELKVNMSIDIPYTEAEQLANTQLLGKTFASGEKQVVVKAINIYGSNGRAVIEATLEGSYNGKIYFTGIPIYNAQKQSIELSELDFSLATRNLLQKTAGWLFHSGIIAKIANNAKFPIGSYFESAKVTANKNLDKVMVLKNILLKGTVSRIDVGGISLTPQSFRVQGLAEGKLEAEVLGLDF